MTPTDIIIILIILIVVVLGALFITVDTIALRQEKRLRATVKQLDKDLAAMPKDASPEDWAVLQARVDATRLEMNIWLRNPFVGKI